MTERLNDFMRDVDFIESRCKIVGFSELKDVDFGVLENIVPYEPFYGDCYFRPPESMANHFLWSFLYRGSSYNYSGVNIYKEIEKKFSSGLEGVYLFEPFIEIDYAIRCDMFRMPILQAFLHFANYSQHVVAFSPGEKVAMYFNSDMNFIVYSRDKKKNPYPLPGVTDEKITEIFRNDIPSPAQNMAEKYLRHIRYEILPNCFERSLV